MKGSAPSNLATRASTALHCMLSLTSQATSYRKCSLRIFSNCLFRRMFIISSRTTSPLIKKKAGLCILRVYRKFPDLIPAEAWAPQLLNEMKDTNLVY